MAGVTYKCPSCGGYLVFDPDSQQWKCPYCGTSYQEDVLLQKEQEYAEAAESEKPETQPDADGGTQVVYHCQSCGSQIMTDETTVATQCYYCHNPVVLQGKLTADMRPDSVLPFTIDKEKAVAAFMDWVKRKRFVPKGFFNKAQVESMQGVYYPHFVTDCDTQAAIDGTGRNVSVVDTGRYIVTTTQHYHVRREAKVRFHGIMRPALQSANRKLSDGIHPFPLEKAKPFAGAYLSGFLAERRDIDAASIQDDVAQEVSTYVEPLLTPDLHYTNYSVSPSIRIDSQKARYVLLPTWVLTYPNKHNVHDPYYYVMNGCTGEVCGKLPIDRKKLWLTAGAVAGVLFVVGCVLSYLLW